MAREKPQQRDYDDIPGTFVFDQERSRQGYGINMFCMSLMKDDNRKAFKANEPRLSEKVQSDAGADRGDPQARLQPHARTRRQHLFHRQARRHRRPFLPPSCRGDDRLQPGRVRQDDAGRGPRGRRQPQQIGVASNVARIVAGVSSRMCPPSAPRSTTVRPESRIGSGCFPGSRNPSNGSPKPGPTFASWSTTTTPRRFRSRWCRPLRSVARRNFRRPTKAGGRGRSRW